MKLIKKFDKFPINISETLVIAFLPIIGYSVAYTSQLGYLNFYGVDEQFISIDFRTILNSMFYASLFSIPSLIIIEFLHTLVHAKFVPKLNLFFLSIATISSPIFIYLLTPESLMFNTSLVLLFYFVTSLIFSPKLPSRKKVLDKKSLKNNLKYKTEWFVPDVLLNKKRKSLIVFIFGSMVFITSSYPISYLMAWNKTTYYVYKTETEDFIIINSNASEKIAVGVDIKNKNLQNRYLIIKDSNDLMLTRTHIGRLSKNFITYENNN